MADHVFGSACSKAILDSIRRLQRQASKEGRGKEFLLALRVAIERLETDPTSWGEPLYRLPALRLQLRCEVVRPLGIEFGVCEDRPLLFIKRVILLAAPKS